MGYSDITSITYLPESPIVVSAYTVGSHLGDYYQRAAVRLSRSCIKFNLKHIIYPLKNAGNWINGCCLKPTVILNALKTFQSPILWIDADAEILKTPCFFGDHYCEMALVADNSNHWLTGTLYVRPEVIDFVEIWQQAASVDANRGIADEITLKRLYYANEDKKPFLKFLPLQYNTTIHAKTDVSEIVIGHYMREDVAASRRLLAVKLPDRLN